MSTFGRYTLVRRVGTGGMAEIWKAKAQGPAGFEKVLAIKKVLPHLVEDGEFIDMFVEEAKLVATLVHPNIVQVFDFGQVGKLDYFIAMEYVAGSNLAQVLRRLGERGARMPLEVALYIVLEACKGLGHAHSKTDMSGNSLAIVHRDVSPQNILVSFGGEVKVTDFGIAKVASALTRTAEGHVRGKLAYMSPEQANTHSMDNRSDLFSLGVVLYELITGRRLFSGSSASEIFAKVTDFRVPAEEDLPNMPYEVRGIVRQAIEPDPDERYQDAMEFETALATALGPDGIVQARHALASIVQRLFEDERKLEMTAPNPVPEAPEYAQTVAQTSGELAVHPPSRQPEVVPQAEPERAPSQPSGLTLARNQTGSKAVSIMPGPPPAGGAAPGTEKRKRIALFAGLGVALLVAAGAGSLVTGLLSGGEAPEPAVTAYGTQPVATLSTVTLPDETPAPTAEPTPEPSPVETREARPRVTPRPVHTRVVAQPTPRPVPAGVGTLTVNARPWVRVFIDGRLVTNETPLRNFKLPAGRHTIRFQNPAARFTIDRTIEIVADRERDVFVDVKTGSVTIR